MKGYVSAIAAACVCGSIYAADLWTHEPAEQGAKPESKHWRDVVGTRVAVEGIAWGVAEKNVGGEYVILNEGTVHVAGEPFLNNRLNGRLVRVTGELELVRVARAKPFAAGPSADVEFYRIKKPSVEVLQQVDWPWMRQAPNANKR